MNRFLRHFTIGVLFIFGLGTLKIQAQSVLSTHANTHRVTGDVLVITMPALALGSTYIWKDNANGAFQFSKVLASTLALSYALKFAIHKPRPNGENNNSFPSAHTSVAFASAGFIHKRYGWKFGVPAYLLASYVGFSRIEAKKHDGWDVFVGALIGVGMGYVFTKTYQPERKISWTSGFFRGYPTLGITLKL